MYQKNVTTKKKNVDLLFIGEGEKNPVFLSMTSIDSFMIIHYIAEEIFFVAIVYMFSLQKKSSYRLIVILKIALKLMKKKQLRSPRKVNMLNSEFLK